MCDVCSILCLLFNLLRAASEPQLRRPRVSAPVGEYALSVLEQRQVLCRVQEASCHVLEAVLVDCLVEALKLVSWRGSLILTLVLYVFGSFDFFVASADYTPKSALFVFLHFVVRLFPLVALLSLVP